MEKPKNNTNSTHAFESEIFEAFRSNEKKIQNAKNAENGSPNGAVGSQHRRKRHQYAPKKVPK